jgi:flagellar motor switch protein FliM
MYIVLIQPELLSQLDIDALLENESAFERNHIEKKGKLKFTNSNDLPTKTLNKIYLIRKIFYFFAV